MMIVTADGTLTESHRPHQNFHAPLIRDFTDAIESGTAPTVTGEIAMATNQIIADAYR